MGPGLRWLPAALWQELPASLLLASYRDIFGLKKHAVPSVITFLVHSVTSQASLMQESNKST